MQVKNKKKFTNEDQARRKTKRNKYNSAFKKQNVNLENILNFKKR